MMADKVPDPVPVYVVGDPAPVDKFEIKDGVFTGWPYDKINLTPEWSLEAYAKRLDKVQPRRLSLRDRLRNWFEILRK